MKNPDCQQADHILQEAAALNPGPWVAHSQQVAQTAQKIGQQLPQIDPAAAYVFGLLHDIGRRAGVTAMRHVLDGYNYLCEIGFEGPARICLTHSFPVPDIDFKSGYWDCSAEELKFIQDFLDQHPYTPYDRLIQLCDAICLPAGPVLMEKRLVDVTLRHGFNTRTLEKWQAFIDIRIAFEKEIGQSIYAFLPGVIENTFMLSGQG